MVTRAEVVSEARSWIDTPYHKNGRVKGAGCDCATLLFCIYVICGLIPPGQEGIFNDPRIVGHDWFANNKERLYLRLVLRHAMKVAEAISFPIPLQADDFSRVEILPGNLVLCKTKEIGTHDENHGAIVTRWPRIIHAVYPKVEEVDASTHWMWNHNRVIVCDPWLKAAISNTYVPEPEIAQ